MQYVRSCLLMGVALLLVFLAACDSMISESNETRASHDVAAPTVESLQQAIAEQGGWEADAYPRIWIRLGGGECRCVQRNEQGQCTLYICQPWDDSTGWGPVLVPRPAQDDGAGAAGGGVEVILTAVEEARVSSRFPDQNFEGEALGVVNYAGNWNERSYVRFDLSSIPADARILEARVELFYYLCDGIDEIAVYPAAKRWRASELTWANQPGPATLDTDLKGALDVINLGPDYPQTFDCGDLDEYVAAPGGSASKPGWFITRLARAWANGSAPNRGLVFMAFPERRDPVPPGRLFAVFGSSEDTPQFPARPPRLRLTYRR